MGCGQYQNGSYGYAGGMLRMSYHPLSFPFQIQAKSFSFCLVERDTRTLSTLEYNVQAPINSITIPFTIGYGGIYYIKVTGFIVGNQILNIPPQDFSTIPYKNGEVVVDSGTVMTWLPPQAYEVPQDAFRKEADNLDLQRVYGSFEGFETCYNMEDWLATVPRMWNMFSDDEELELNVINYLTPYKVGVYCLAFFPMVESDRTPYPYTIFGDTLLQTTRLTHDLARMLLSFTPDQC